MKASSSFSARVDKRAAGLVAAGLLFVFSCSKALSATVVAGSVTDEVTTAPIAGANLQITNGGVLLTSTTSDADGTFRLIFNLPATPATANLKLTLRADSYASNSKDVIVTAGRTDQNSYRLVLTPKAVADCRRQKDHLVVVGYFRPPVCASGQSDLASRIVGTLDYDIVAPFQKVNIAQQTQPVVMACEKVVPQALADYSSLAQTLKADAFMSGYVAPVAQGCGSKVKVQMTIVNRFRLQDAPVQVATPNVDLDDPQTARLELDARIAIFAALVAGYEQRGQHTECVLAANAAEQSIGTLPTGLAEARQRCRLLTPNSGLARGGSP